MSDEFLACPSCGSEFFYSKAEGQRILFHVGSEHTPIVVMMGDDLSADHVRLDSMHCGACTWAGEVGQLVPGH